MGIEYALLAAFGLQLVIIVALAVGASLRGKWTEATSWVVGAVVAMAPPIWATDLKIADYLSAILVMAGALGCIAFAIDRKYARLGILAVIGALLLAGSWSYYGAPSYLQFLGLLLELAVLFTPLIAASAIYVIVKTLVSARWDARGPISN